MSYPQRPFCAHEQPCSCKELRDCLEAFIPTLMEYLRDHFEEDVADEAASLAWMAAMEWIADGKAALMNSEQRRAYLCRTGRNIGRNLLRRQARTPLGKAIPLLSDPPINADPLDALIAPEEAADSELVMTLFKECLASMDDEDRCLLELRHVDEATFAELGDLLECHEGTAWRRVERAEDYVRDMFRSKARKNSPMCAS